MIMYSIPREGKDQCQSMQSRVNHDIITTILSNMDSMSNAII